MATLRGCVAGSRVILSWGLWGGALRTARRLRHARCGRGDRGGRGPRADRGRGEAAGREPRLGRDRRRLRLLGFRRDF
ncbi:MAG: hypothetical protein MZV64_34355 [Ignavibacteriales bacterium]|nr:hypothetical protein [Ignavibacteriales bacterium]